MKEKKDALETLFSQLENQWDTETPRLGHSDRFLKKLNATPIQKKKKNWLPLSLAASLLLIVGMISFYQLKNEQPIDQWQNASSQTKETHDYFASVVEKELIDLKSKQTPETEEIINDALNQMKVFDQDYQKIISELQKNGDTKQLLHAMILNFQTRISFLEEVIKKIEIINLKNTIENEKFI
ncbi:anti-sigma factor [Flavobacterium orientale]|uniref:Anti-sigma factor n=1 Tax=Flavobacterium orientale TaxID=1756020 RepID=A0A916Y7P9_9FLAO|nr:anti-sigma factor [Flavobacterium orientale]GGD33387.1 hypothetical protein GCM10011343_24270 [Flavobacterium orientale]